MRLRPSWYQWETLSPPLRSETSESTTISVICLGPQFRLLRVCEACQNNGSLDGVDALLGRRRRSVCCGDRWMCFCFLGCPVVLCKDDVFGRFETLPAEHRRLVCSSLFHTINWFLEVSVLPRYNSRDYSWLLACLLVFCLPACFQTPPTVVNQFGILVSYLKWMAVGETHMCYFYQLFCLCHLFTSCNQKMASTVKRSPVHTQRP